MRNTHFLIRQEKLFAYRVGELEGDGGNIYILGINIPEAVDSYADFVTAMENTESSLLDSVKKILTVQA